MARMHSFQSGKVKGSTSCMNSPYNSKMTGSLMVRRENRCQSRPSQGYWIANAHRIAYRPGGPDHVLDLSPSPRVPVAADTGALFSSPTPPRVQLVLGAASHLRRPGQRPGTEPSR